MSILQTRDLLREEESFDPISLFPEGPVVYKSSIHPVRLTADSIRRRQNESDSEVDHFIVDLVDFMDLRKVPETVSQIILMESRI